MLIHSGVLTVFFIMGFELPFQIYLVDLWRHLAEGPDQLKRGLVYTRL